MTPPIRENIRSLEISEVEIFPVKPRNGLIAFASCVINGQIFVGSIGVHTRPDGGVRLVFPLKTIPNGKQIPCCHPITREAGKILLNAITAKLDGISTWDDKNENVTKSKGQGGEKYGYSEYRIKVSSRTLE